MSVPYKFYYINDEMISLFIQSEDILDEIKEKLEHAAYIEEYEECNRYKANRIKDLLNGIYLELR